ncbi:MAG TPA: triose-phosphate isomerase [Frankiaceae bacterium]|nr:triose-phosphate isomerase [Frankiaceae bacterium]
MAILVGTSTKMNLTSTEAAGYLDTLLPLVADLADRRLFVLLPFTSIWVARERLAGTAIGWGAQDVHPDDAGAHTGDVSAPMLADLGCTYVMIGHHERRRDHGETDELIAAKVAAIHRWGMTAILCVGEQQRLPFDDVVEVIDRQLAALRGTDPLQSIVAYEPSWAIGVGASPASPDWVQGVHDAIRRTLAAERAGDRTIPIIYGGSVSLDAAPALLARPAVDGLFVGRQALDPRVFAAIAHAQPAVNGGAVRS